MRKLLPTTALLFVAVATIRAAGAQEELISGEAASVVLSDARPSIELTYEARGRSMIYLGAESDTADPVLLLHDDDGGVLARDDNSGGGTSAFLKREAAAGDRFRVIVRGSRRGHASSDGSIQVKLTEVPRLAREHLPRLQEAARWIEESRGASERREYERARELSRRALDRLKSFETPLAEEVIHAFHDVLYAIYYSRDMAVAREPLEILCEVRARLLPGNHWDLLAHRSDLAGVCLQLGDLASARGLLEKVLDVRTGILPDHHPDLQTTRTNLAAVLSKIGDLAAARELEEQVLEIQIRTLPDDDPDLQDTRNNLAGTIRRLGDLEGARALYEKVLEVRTKILSDDDQRLQRVRGNLAVVLRDLGHLVEAKALLEKQLEVATQTLPGDHPDVQTARVNLAVTMRTLGDLGRAQALLEQALEVRTRLLPNDHPDVQIVRCNLAVLHVHLGDLERASMLFEQELATRTRTLPDDHPDLQNVRCNLAATRARLRGDVSALIGDVLRGMMRRIESFAPLLSPRELRVLTEQERSRLSVVLSLLRLPELTTNRHLASRAFSLVETLRGVEPSSMRYQRALARVEDEELRRLREQAARANKALVLYAQGHRPSSSNREGATEAEAGGAGGKLDLFQQLLRAKESAESQVSRYASTLANVDRTLVADSPEKLATALDKGSVAIGFWRYRWVAYDEETRRESAPVPSYLAHVLRDDGTASRVELGPADAIDEAVNAWRTLIRAEMGDSSDEISQRGVKRARDATLAAHGTDPEREAGARLRELIFDPLVPHLRGATRLTVAPDDALHLVPLMALPLADGVLGDRYAFNVRTTLRELTTPSPEADGPPSLLALGGVDYDLAPGPAAKVARASGQPSSGGGGRLRDGAWRSFAALPATADEVDFVARHFETRNERARVAAEVVFLKGEEASRESLELFAPRARYLHLATHGYFLDESVPSMSDERVIDETVGVVASRDLGAQVRGYLPMTLCGLALAGANASETRSGRIPGILTAQELAGWDLDNCKLAVLSACDTNVGVRRAGHGIASLQEALYAAGVQSSITSLWKVPDRATQELFSEFYRRLWTLGEGKAEALWNAQQALRRAKGPDRKPLYPTRDWAAWVLVGDPR